MPIPVQNPGTVTVNAVLVPSIQIDTRPDASGKLVTGIRCFLQPAQVQNAGLANESWKIAGVAQPLSIPNVASPPGAVAGASLLATDSALEAVAAAAAAATTSAGATYAQLMTLTEAAIVAAITAANNVLKLV